MMMVVSMSLKNNKYQLSKLKKLHFQFKEMVIDNLNPLQGQSRHMFQPIENLGLVQQPISIKSNNLICNIGEPNTEKTLSSPPRWPPKDRTKPGWNGKFWKVPTVRSKGYKEGCLRKLSAGVGSWSLLMRNLNLSLSMSWCVFYVYDLLN